MLRGYKRIESRKRRLAAGWYYLHVGRQSLQALPPECLAALQQTWPQAPSEEALSKSCVLGMVCLGKVIPADKISNAWVCKSLPLVHEITAAIEFSKEVPWPKGKQAVWYLHGDELRMKLKDAAQSGIRRNFEPLWPHLADERPCAKRSRVMQPWAGKKRKRRADAGHSRSPAQPLFTMSQRRRLLLRSPLKKPRLAKAPASQAMQIDVTPQRGPEQRSLAHRVAAGRTLELLTTLMAVHFLKIGPEGRIVKLQPRGGLFAYWHKKPVFILSVWVSRKIPLADVVPLNETTYEGCAVLKAKYTDTQTCRQTDLKDVGLHFQVADCVNDRRGASCLVLSFSCNLSDVST